ncbi:MBL fold metallo-hydrolase [Coprothermobacteraceae bacterium]|nr:MBL fold metallo-hydrolase [Coprothermobacteraceae bacterium]
MWETIDLKQTNVLWNSELRLVVDAPAGKGFRNLIDEKRPSTVFLSHHHLDHCGGVKLALQNSIRVSTCEEALQFLRLQQHVPAMYFGGFYPKEMNPEKVPVNEIEPESPELTWVELPGHTPYLKGLADKDTLFGFDAFFGKEILAKYGIPYHYDGLRALESLKKVRDEFELFVPSHGSPGRRELIDANIEAIERLVHYVLSQALGLQMEKIVRNTVTAYSDPKDVYSWSLNASAVRGIISGLQRIGLLQVEMTAVGPILWKA